MEEKDHSALYIFGIIFLLIGIVISSIASVTAIAMVPFFRGEQGVGPGEWGGKTIEDTGYFGKGYMFDVDAATAEDLEKKLKGTAMAGLGVDFIAAAQKYHLNPIYIAAHAAHESGWGTSPIAREKKNLFGYEAYDSCPSCAKSFPSYRDGIMFVMGKIKRNYLTPGGKYYEGETLEAMNVHYASDKLWAAKIKRIMVEFYKAIGKESSF